MAEFITINKTHIIDKEFIIKDYINSKEPYIFDIFENDTVKWSIKILPYDSKNRGIHISRNNNNYYKLSCHFSIYINNIIIKKLPLYEGDCELCHSSQFGHDTIMNSIDDEECEKDMTIKCDFRFIDTFNIYNTKLIDINTKDSSDVSFICEDKTETPIYAYKSILINKSPYFKGMFVNDFIESNTTEPIILIDVKYDAFLYILNYMYNNITKIHHIKDTSVLQNIYTLAEMYDLQCLIHFLQNNIIINTDNFGDWYNFAKTHKVNLILDKIVLFVKNISKKTFLDSKGIDFFKNDMVLLKEFLYLILVPNDD